MQPTLAFHPGPDDLEEGYFDIPVLTFNPGPKPCTAVIGQTDPSKQKRVVLMVKRDGLVPI